MSTQTLPIQAAKATEIISRDPATGEEIGRAPQMSASEVAAAVKRARAAQPAWAALSFAERGKVILKARELMLERVDQLGLLVSRETGKPISEATSMEI